MCSRVSCSSCAMRGTQVRRDRKRRHYADSALWLAANLNIRPHCLVPEGVYRRSTEGKPVFVEVPAPTDEALRAVLHKIITCRMRLLTRRGRSSRRATRPTKRH